MAFLAERNRFRAFLSIVLILLAARPVLKQLGLALFNFSSALFRSRLFYTYGTVIEGLDYG